MKKLLQLSSTSGGTMPGQMPLQKFSALAAAHGCQKG